MFRGLLPLRIVGMRGCVKNVLSRSGKDAIIDIIFAILISITISFAISFTTTITVASSIKGLGT